MSNKNLKNSIETYLEKKDMDALKNILNNTDEIKVLDIIQELSLDEQVIVFRLLSKDRALFVFEELNISSRQDLISSFTKNKAIEMIKDLAPDDRVRLLDELPAAVAKRMLASLSFEERAEINLLMGYETETAGRIMTPEYVRLRRDMTVAEALEKVKEDARDKETIYILYITDNQRRLEGVLSLRDLLIANADDKIETIMQINPTKVSTDTDQEEVALTLQKLDLLAIPVVDKENRLVGIITVDDAMDILEDEATEDIYNKAGMADIKSKETTRSEVLIKGSLFDIWKVRLPFLVITLLGGLLAGTVIGSFEEALESIAIVAIFIPLIMDMGGNIGIQSSTVFLRGVLLGHIHLDSIWKYVVKEVSVGLSIGTVVGVVSGFIAYFWYGIPGLGISIGLALLITMTLASFLGFVVPYILIKLNIDQAAGTDPIITSIKDITGLLVYFLLVSYFLGHMM